MEINTQRKSTWWELIPPCAFRVSFWGRFLVVRDVRAAAS